MNLYLCFPLVLGTILITLSLVALIPQGMWLFLAGLVFGVVAVTYALIAMWAIE